jgi:hypothetical protein
MARSPTSIDMHTGSSVLDPAPQGATIYDLKDQGGIAAVGSGLERPAIALR